jgi:meiotic recombination protein REC8
MGVSRVYDQQCGYVLQDALAMQNALRGLMRTSRDNQLDAVAGKAK